MGLNRREFWQLMAVLMIGLIVRIGLAVGVEEVLKKQPDRMFLIPGDAEGYWDLAGDLLKGDRYEIYGRHVLRMPGFPAVVALGRSLGHDSRLGVRMLLAVVAVLGIGGVYVLGLQLYGHRVGLLAAAFVSLSPLLAGFGILILSEGAFATTLVWALVALAEWMYQLQRSATWPRLLISAMNAGLLAALAISMRPTWFACAGLLPGLLVIWWVFTEQEDRWKRLTAGVASATVLGATILIILLPWAIRNQLVAGKFTFTTLWVGASLYDGLHPGATGDSDMTFFETDGLAGRLSEAEVDGEYRRRAWSFVAANPWRALELAWVKQSRYWNIVPNYPEFRRWWILLPAGLSTLLLYCGTLLELWFRPRNVLALLLCLVPILEFALIHLLFVGSMRYRLPAEFPLAVIAASGWLQLYGRFNAQRAIAREGTPC